MRVKITSSSHNYWYEKFIGEIFDVGEEKNFSSYLLLNTFHNKKILLKEKNEQERKDLLNRIQKKPNEVGLGISDKHCIVFEPHLVSNASAAYLLSEEW